jgi:hypothetical protein
VDFLPGDAKNQEIMTRQARRNAQAYVCLLFRLETADRAAVIAVGLLGCASTGTGGPSRLLKKYRVWL